MKKLVFYIISIFLIFVLLDILGLSFEFNSSLGIIICIALGVTLYLIHIKYGDDIRFFFAVKERQKFYNEEAKELGKKYTKY